MILTGRLARSLTTWLMAPMTHKLSDWCLTHTRLTTHSPDRQIDYKQCETGSLFDWTLKAPLTNEFMWRTTDWLRKQHLKPNINLLHALWTDQRLERQTGVFFYKSKPGTDRHCNAFRETRDLTLLKIHLAPTNRLTTHWWQTDRQTDRHTASSVVKANSRQFALEFKEIACYIADCLI